MMTARQTKRRGTRADLTPVARRLREMYETGFRLLKEIPVTNEWGQHGIRDQALALGKGEQNIRTLRRFADPIRGYDEAELAQLIEQCETHGRDIGMPLIRMLLTIPDKSARAELQQRMLVEGWSVSKTGNEIIRRLGRRRQGGRAPKVADDPEAALLQVQEMTITWRRWVRAFSAKISSGGFLVTGVDDDEKKRKVQRSPLPDELVREIEAVSSVIEKLSTSVGRQINTYRQHRERRRNRKR